MSSTPTKLALALEDAKEKIKDTILAQASSPGPVPIPQEKHIRPASSKLNTLLGTKHVKDERPSLFKRIGVPQRPTYDLVSDHVLGKDVEEHRTFLENSSTYATHVAQRLNHLRMQRQSDLETDQTADDSDVFVGVEGDGRPVWNHILDEQRGWHSTLPEIDLQPPSIEDPFHARQVLDIKGDWPKRLAWSDRLTFRQWFVCDENIRATQACEAIIDAPSSSLNPYVIVGQPHAGCSHLLHATGQALLRRQEGHVLMVGAADVANLDALTSQWQDALAAASAILVDDVHEFAAHQDWSHQLGILLDHALNLGLQVIVAGRSKPDRLPPSRLKEVLRHSASSTVQIPSRATLMAYGTWRSSQLNLLVNDVHLAAMVSMEPTGWRAMEGRLQQLVVAFDSGAVLLEHDSVVDLLNGDVPGRTAKHQALEQQRVDDTASQLIGQAIDSVYSSVDTGGVELHSPLASMDDDDYEPPEWDASEFMERDDSNVNQRVAQTIAKITPAAPSVLDVNERERHLIDRSRTLEVDDAWRAADVLAALDEEIDARIDHRQSFMKQDSEELNRLEERMVFLAQEATEADIERLISIADELRELEERLAVLDPVQQPLPRLEHTRSPSTQQGMDEYEPEGDWDIDEAEVEANDLLMNEPPQKTLIRLGRIRPKTVLMGEEE